MSAVEQTWVVMVMIDEVPVLNKIEKEQSVQNRSEQDKSIG